MFDRVLNAPTIVKSYLTNLNFSFPMHTFSTPEIKGGRERVKKGSIGNKWAKKRPTLGSFCIIET